MHSMKASHQGGSMTKRSAKNREDSPQTFLFHCILIMGCTMALSSTPASAGDGTVRKVARPVHNRYIVKLSDSLSPAAVRSLASVLAAQQGGKMHKVWDAVVPSFTVEVSEAAAKAIARHPFVDF